LTLDAENTRRCREEGEVIERWLALLEDVSGMGEEFDKREKLFKRVSQHHLLFCSRLSLSPLGLDLEESLACPGLELEVVERVRDVVVDWSRAGRCDAWLYLSDSAGLPGMESEPKKGKTRLLDCSL
jgi:hypothetical protein